MDFHHIDQFVSQQREAVETDNGRDKERRRDRDRRHDRNRERDRDDRRRHRDRRDHRDKGRDRRSRESDHSRSRDRRSGSKERYEDAQYSEEETYSNYSGEYYNSRDDQSSSYGDIDERFNDDYRQDDYRRQVSSRESKAADKWISLSPTNTIILKGLASDIDEKDIKAQLMMSATPVTDVRLVRDKISGVSRGFAFVEFQSVGDAQQWMEQNQGRLYLLNQYYVNMYYSTPKRELSQFDRSNSTNDKIAANVNPLMGVVGDWICSKCGVHNFKRREQCFKCNVSRDASDRSKEADGYGHVGHNPCNTLILRGLDALTSEESLSAALSQVSALTLKNIRVIRDETKVVSKGYAFLELNSIADSTFMLDAVNKLQGVFEVDGKAVLVNYAKNTFSTVMATMNSQYYAGADYTQYQQAGYYGEDGQYYDSSYYGQYDYSQYYNQDGTPVTSASDAEKTQTDSTNAAAAVAQAAINKHMAMKNIQKKHENIQKELMEKMIEQQKLANMTPEERIKHQAEEWAGHTTTAADTDTEYAQYPEPDVSTYQYEESSGYYYDPTTGLYYDANTQYYYNSTTGQFMYWDGEKKTYLPAPGEGETLGEDQRAGDPKNKDNPRNKDKVKVAKKIAKDMEKWAKTLNSQKDAQRDAFKKMFQPIGQQKTVKKEAAAADAGFALLEKSKKEDSRMMPPPPSPMGGKPREKSALVASYGDDSDNDDADEDQQQQQKIMNGGVLDESKLTDFSKMACLLCKRQFPTHDALQRHQQLSDLHKKNLEELRKSAGAVSDAGGQEEMDSIAMTIQYRDRAKERRQKYGAPAPPVPKKSQQYTVPFEQPTTQGIRKDNKGSKLLQKMGWNEGQGLGKKGQGIVDPIMASKRTQGAGLGVLASNVDIDPNDTYKEACKKIMKARFNEMD